MQTATDSSPGSGQPDEPIAGAFLTAPSSPPASSASVASSSFKLIARDDAGIAQAPCSLGGFDPWLHTGWIARGSPETWALGVGENRAPGGPPGQGVAEWCAQLRRGLDRTGRSGFDRYGSGNALRRVAVEDKRLLDAGADVHQLLPVRHRWARDRYLAACDLGRRWRPDRIDMKRDIGQWRAGPSEAERRIVERTLGFFSSASSLAASAAALGLYRHITNAECRQFLLRQAAQAAVHVDACEHVVASLELDPGRIFNMCHEVPSMTDRNEFLLPFIDTLIDPDFRTGTPDSDQKFLACVIVFVCLMQGLFFASAAGPVLALGRRGRMPGTARHFRYVLQETSAQRDFGIELIGQIKRENPQLWTRELRGQLIELFRVAVGLDYRWLEDTMDGAAPGLDVSAFKRRSRFLADRGSRDTGLGTLYPGDAIDPSPREPVPLRAVAP